MTLPESPKPITGHIDVVQVRNGLIHLLDYKPKARQIDPVYQLVVYALAFASRTRLPVKTFKCAWFDEKDYFEFFSLQAVKPKSERGPRFMSEQEKCPILAGILNPQPNPQNATSCTTYAVFGSPRGLVCCCKT